jgi:hypothetical protein
LVCTIFVCFGLVIGILFLEETHEDKRERRDLGVEAGKWILGRLGSKTGPKLKDFEETVSFLTDDEKYAGYDSTAESSPRLSSVRTSTTEVDRDIPKRLLRPAKRALSWRGIFNNQVRLTIAAFGILAL